MTNDETSPVPVVTHPAREGFDETLPAVFTKFTMDFSADMDVGDIAGSGATYTVPNGKRLVIEYASFDPSATPTAPDPGAAYTAQVSIRSAVFAATTSHVLESFHPL